ncbi:hypothetical protein [Rhizobium sp. LC145]|jgi:hypothetical protein|uniref:hypothetical protein n=1 Tax=Rhizobium sp. LC145 TaxID=1120688 RepID=UPI000629E7D3|nr:hypothetical protein [Rhizobium sp. LC145]KKX25665.1 hypothetical protein YH62_24865 [Rhizobium sp. LC145]
MGCRADRHRHQLSWQPSPSAFSSWAGPAQITSTLGFTTIEVPLAGGQIASLAGVTQHDAAGFISAANEAFPPTSSNNSKRHKTN